MDQQPSNASPFVRRLKKSEDSRIGIFAGWYLAFTVFPAGGFYLFTIASPASTRGDMQHFYDLRPQDIYFGDIGALIGLALGICVALWLTFVYPVLKEREEAWEAEQEHHVSDDLTAEDELSTDPGH